MWFGISGEHTVSGWVEALSLGWHTAGRLVLCVGTPANAATHHQRRAVALLPVQLQLVAAPPVHWQVVVVDAEPGSGGRGQGVNRGRGKSGFRLLKVERGGLKEIDRN